MENLTSTVLLETEMSILRKFPTSTNICALVAHLILHLRGIPSQKLTDHGFSGMVQQVKLYTLNSAEPWVDPIDPVPMCG